MSANKHETLHTESVVATKLLKFSGLPTKP